jgi:hypothetical protein
MLTQLQLQAIKADILATPELSAFPNNTDGNIAIADFYNLLATPTFFVWRTDVPTRDVKNAIVWTEYIGSTSVAERDALNLIISNGIVNAADPNIRQGFATIFGSPQQATTRANLVAISKRSATRIEKLLAVGTGSEVAPDTMAFEGKLSGQQVEVARNLP